MTIDWTRPVCTKHETPFVGRLLDNCPTSGKRRVATISPTLLVKGFVPSDDAAKTVWRYDESGSAREGAEPSDNDLVNFDPEDGVIRVQLSGAKSVCSRKIAA